jgi:hypothetical protein
VLLLLGILIAIVIGVAALSPAQEKTSGPSGAIVLSSVSDPSLPFLDSYVLDVHSKQLTLNEPSNVSQENMYSYSPDDSKIAFLGTTQSQVQGMISNKQRGDPMQVYRATVVGSGSPFPTTEQATALTNTIADQKMAPVISNDGQSVLYTTLSANVSATTTRDTTGYSVRLIGSSRGRAVSVGGMWPQWYSSSLFYFVAPDGVRAYDISSATSTLLIPIEGQSNFKIAVSHDRHLFAFSNPDSHTVFVYAISSGGLQLKPVASIDVAGYWMVFSPDDAYMAVQTANSDTAFMAIFDTTNFAAVGDPIPLPSLDNSRLFVTAWLQ